MKETAGEQKARLRDRLELPRAILLQLRDTCLYNSMIDEAIEDIEHLLMKGAEE